MFDNQQYKLRLIKEKDLVNKNKLNSEGDTEETIKKDVMYNNCNKTEENCDFTSDEANQKI